MLIPAMALLQQHSAWRDILINRWHGIVQRLKLGGIPNWGRNRAVKTNRLVCLYLWNHMHDRYKFLCACCSVPLQQVNKIPRGMNNSGRFQVHSKVLAIFAAAVVATFAAKGSIQWPVASCSRRDHSVWQASANRNLENSERKQCGLSAGNGVMGVHSVDVV